MAAPFDLYDQAVLTELINRPITTQFEDQPRLGNLIAPMRSIQARTAKLQVAQALAFGVGQYRAPDAAPGLYKGNQTWRQEIIELALLEEMEKISEETYLQLSSPDPIVARAAGLSLVERGQILQRRNERLTQKAIWAAFSGKLTIPYPSGDEIVIDYPLTAAQKPVVSNLWTDLTNSDPVADMKAFSNTLASTSGYFGVRHHMSSDTWDLVVRNLKVRALLTATNRSMLIPTKQDVLTLLRDGTDIVLYDDGYRAEDQGSARGVPDSLTRFLPKGKVLTTTEYQIEGVNIAETLDGQVVVGAGYNQLQIVQGSASEVILDPLSKNQFLRVASARIPRMIYPEAFLYAHVAASS